jgi:flagellar hook protein FlgE
MRYKNNRKKLFSPFALIIFLFPLLFIFTGCESDSGEKDRSARQTELRETELEIHVVQTLRSQGGESVQSTATSQETTIVNQPQAQQPTNTQQAPTQDINATQNAEAATKVALETQTALEELAQTPVGLSEQELQEKMKNANILVYEDMIGNLDTNRYVKDTLENMGLPFKDDGSAEGWLKSDLNSGAPNGQPWDLVIVANESKANVSGEFFEYVVDALDSGASVIMEVWYLDKTYSGTASTILSRCGIAFQTNWERIPPARMIMFPLDSSHPVLQQPNAGLGFTDVTSYWWDDTGVIDYDIGDLVKLTGAGDAELILGTKATEKSTHGTVTVCLGGQLTIQTFSSHQLTYKTMQPLWENYIYNALKFRFENQ